MRIIAALLTLSLFALPAFADDAWLTEEQVQNIAGSNFTALDAACGGTFYKPPKTLLKSQLSGHVPLGDWRRRDNNNGSCSLVGGGLPVQTVLAMVGLKRYINFLAFNGERIGQFRKYDTFGPIYKFRFYTTVNICKNVATKARNRGGVDVAGGCVKFQNGCACARRIVGRTGSVK